MGIYLLLAYTASLRYSVPKLESSFPDIIHMCTGMYKILRSLEKFMRGKSTDVQLCHF